jgi:hypothetical protein
MMYQRNDDRLVAQDGTLQTQFSEFGRVVRYNTMLIYAQRSKQRKAPRRKPALRFD